VYDVAGQLRLTLLVMIVVHHSSSKKFADDKQLVGEPVAVVRWQ
jgi:hypothetical protein